MVAVMATFTVTAQRGKSSVWVLEVPELGVVSQTRSLAHSDAEVREAVAYQSGLDESEFDLDVVPVLPDEVRHLKDQADALQNKADEAMREAVRAKRSVAAAIKGEGYSIRDMGRILGVSHQRAADLAAG